MRSIREILFQQYALQSLNNLIAEYRKKHMPKKGDRFNYKGITYEIGPPTYMKDGIEFEISSKIPQDDLVRGVSLKKYFEGVKKIVSKAKKKYSSADMENIARDLTRKDSVEKGYIKLRYVYKDSELYNEKKIQKEAGTSSAKDLKAFYEEIPELNTMAGKMILREVRNNIFTFARSNMESLIKANEEARKKLCKKGAASRSR